MTVAVRHFGQRRRGPRTAACDRLVVRLSPVETALEVLYQASAEGFKHRKLMLAERDLDRVLAAPQHAEAWGIVEPTAAGVRRFRLAAKASTLTAHFSRLPPIDAARELLTAPPDAVCVDAEGLGPMDTQRLIQFLTILYDGSVPCVVTGWPACALERAGVSEWTTERLESRWRVDLRGKTSFNNEDAVLEAPDRRRFVRTEACRSCDAATYCDGVSLRSLEAGPMPLPHPIQAIIPRPEFA